MTRLNVYAGPAGFFIIRGGDDDTVLDAKGRPKFAYGRTIHEHCPRRAHFDAGRFAEEFGDEGHRLGYCLYKMGCRGPTTYNSCSTIEWNGGLSWPVKSGHGCLGCAEDDFWDKGSFYSPVTNLGVTGNVEHTADTVGGVLAGLLGIGGGIVIVPMLEFALGVVGVDESVRMHIAVATSLATIVPTSISSAQAHHRRDAIDFSVVRYWSPWIAIGAVAGIVIAANVGGDFLAAVFAVVAFAAALKMVLPLDDTSLAADIPRGVFGPVIPLNVGAISTLMGIGGGTLSVTAMAATSRALVPAIA